MQQDLIFRPGTQSGVGRTATASIPHPDELRAWGPGREVVVTFPTEAMAIATIMKLVGVEQPALGGTRQTWAVEPAPRREVALVDLGDQRYRLDLIWPDDTVTIGHVRMLTTDWPQQWRFERLETPYPLPPEGLAVWIRDFRGSPQLLEDALAIGYDPEIPW